MCVRMVARLHTSKAKINVFEKNSSLRRGPFGAVSFENFSKTLDFSLLHFFPDFLAHCDRLLTLNLMEFIFVCVECQPKIQKLKSSIVWRPHDIGWFQICMSEIFFMQTFQTSAIFKIKLLLSWVMTL